MNKINILFLLVFSLKASAGINFSNGRPFPTISDVAGNVGISTAVPGQPFAIAVPISSGTFVITTGTHIEIGGAKPTVRNCGTSPSLYAGANDSIGTIATGGGTVLSCNIIFQSSWTATPKCFFMNASAFDSNYWATSNIGSVTALSTINFGGSDVNYFCAGLR